MKTMSQIIKCGDCWAHYEIGQLHICDPLLKAIVTRKRNEEDEDVELGEE